MGDAVTDVSAVTVIHDYRREMMRRAKRREWDRKMAEVIYPPVTKINVELPAPRTVTAAVCGDPMPGRSALDQKRNAGELR